MKFVNLTPHRIVLNNGTVFESEGVCRVDSSYTPFDENGISRVVFGEVTGLPEPQEGVVYIVSGLVVQALKGKRDDVVSPATGHPDCVRKDGHPVSVPGFCC
jgi:hypothetical protein